MLNNRVRRRRDELGLAQKDVALAIGISRQSLAAIEAGRAVPSVAIALRLARVLSSEVESLFAGNAAELLEVRLCGKVSGKGARVVLGSVRDAWVAHPLVSEQFAPSQYSADAFVVTATRAARAKVELAQASSVLRDSLLIGGCAPGLSVLCDKLNGAPGPGRFRWLTQSNTGALRGLSRGDVHLAGVHLSDETPAAMGKVIARYLPTQRARVVALATWEAGLALAAGNPARVRSAKDLGRPQVRVVMREEGAGARSQLERFLREAAVDVSAVLARASVAHSHMEVAQALHLGAADVGFTIRGAAQAFGLPFLPLLEERFDLVVPEDLASEPRVLRLFDTLTSHGFRRELNSLGYDTRVSGSKIVDVQLG